MALVNVKFRVHCTEYERGWGQRPWHADFDTRVSAESFMERVNNHPAGPVPDEYDVAHQIEVIVEE